MSLIVIQLIHLQKLVENNSDMSRTIQCLDPVFHWKSDMGETYVPKGPNDLVQLDFWGPFNYVRGRKKYVLCRKWIALLREPHLKWRL